MIEKKNAECVEVAAVSHSDNEQSSVHTTIIPILRTGLRGIAKLVELFEMLIGEAKLVRQAEERRAEQAKRIADSLERLQGDVLAKNETLTDIGHHVLGIHGNTSSLQPEVSKIVNGLKLRPQYNAEDFHV